MSQKQTHLMLLSYPHLKNPKTSDVIYYTKISENKATLFFYRGKQNEKHHTK